MLVVILLTLFYPIQTVALKVINSMDIKQLVEILLAVREQYILWQQAKLLAALMMIVQGMILLHILNWFVTLQLIHVNPNAVV
jgi:hypothetical protein